MNWDVLKVFGISAFIFVGLLYDSYKVSPMSGVVAMATGVASVLLSYRFGLNGRDILIAAVGAIFAADCACRCDSGKLPPFGFGHFARWDFSIKIPDNDFAPGTGKYARSRPNIAQQRHTAAWIAAGFAIPLWLYFAAELRDTEINRRGFNFYNGIIVLPGFAIFVSWCWIYFGGRMLGIFKRKFWFAGQIVFAAALIAFISAVWYEHGEAKCGPDSPPGASPPFCVPMKLSGQLSSRSDWKFAKMQKKNWWRRGELNPRPRVLHSRRLHA